MFLLRYNVLLQVMLVKAIVKLRCIESKEDFATGFVMEECF